MTSYTIATRSYTSYDNLKLTIVSHEVDLLGDFWLATSTLHVVPFPVVSWEVEVHTYPDVAIGFAANLC